MRVNDLWWKCPKCGGKVEFGEELYELFCDNGEAFFCAESGVPFYVITCENEECNATWTFSISNMYEENWEDWED